MLTLHKGIYGRKLKKKIVIDAEKVHIQLKHNFVTVSRHSNSRARSSTLEILEIDQKNYQVLESEWNPKFGLAEYSHFKLPLQKFETKFS